MNKEKIKNWLSNKYNFTFVLILAFAILIRIFFMIATKNQPLWWDEAEYLSIAKHWTMGLDYNVPSYRPVVLPLIGAFAFTWGLGINSIKFIIGFLPSIGLIAVTYLMVSRYMNKKVALVSSLIVGTGWVLIFNALRIHADPLAAFMSALTIYIFLIGYEKSSVKIMGIAGLLLGLSFITKLTMVILVFTLFGFIAITARFNAFRRKDVWVFALSAFAVFLVYIIYANLMFGSFFAPFFEGSHVIQTAAGENPSGLGTIKWTDFMQIYVMMKPVFFIFFLIGLPVFFSYLLYFDRVLKNYKEYKKESFKAVWTIFLVLAVIFFFFINRYIEPRLILPMSLTLFVISADGIVWIYNRLRKAKKELAFLAIGIILILGVYGQLSHANSLIEVKKDTYADVRDAGDWLKINSPIDSVILSISRTQIPFYSERKTVSFSNVQSPEEMNEFIEETGADYVIVSVYEPHPQWINSWIGANQNNLETSNIYTLNNQPSLIIYRVK